MKRTEQLKGQIFEEVQNSGFYKNVQSQVKAHVLEIIEMESNSTKHKLGFQYQHPLLSKLKKYPLTLLCMDLIQQFLESFKFKHTLNVFKKQINRTHHMNRRNLMNQFNIDLSSKDQSVLLGIVGQLASGNVKILEKTKNIKKKQKDQHFEPRKNNFINEDTLKINHQKQQPQTKKKEPFYYNVEPNKKEPERQQEKKQEAQKVKKQKSKSEVEKNYNSSSQINNSSQKINESSQEIKEKQWKEKKKQEKKEGATDLLSDVLGQFSLKKNEINTDEQFRARKAYSQQKKQKQIAPQEKGTNKIRGISAGKIVGGMGSMNSLMKFSSFAAQPKNESQVEEEFDELQQSRDSTRRNPLFSSSQSGFDKSMGFDQSVDSNAIEDYEYVERAKKFNKKR